ncbi:unnamed protein product [Ixodes persulcatus]
MSERTGNIARTFCQQGSHQASASSPPQRSFPRAKSRTNALHTLNYSPRRGELYGPSQAHPHRHMGIQAHDGGTRNKPKGGNHNKTPSPFPVPRSQTSSCAGPPWPAGLSDGRSDSSSGTNEELGFAVRISSFSTKHNVRLFTGEGVLWRPN